MPKIFKALSLCCCLFAALACSGWGFYAHYRINHLAVFTLPVKMRAFFELHANYVTEHAVSADKRRYVDSMEAPRHYLNADHYGKRPFAAIPLKWDDAAKKYGSDTLIKYGLVPWVIEENYYKLVRAFKEHDTSAILNTAANLGHYVADAHVPLHLTMNHDGQLTGQKGIHGLWESRLPELFGDQYNYYAGKARYIENPLNEAFKICRASFKEVDSVLTFEKRLSASFPPDKKYVMEKRGSRKVQEYSPDYAKAYQAMLHGMVQRRLRASIQSVGSFWYSAWIDAGQPDLNKLMDRPMTAAEKQEMVKEEGLYRLGKVVISGK